METFTVDQLIEFIDESPDLSRLSPSADPEIDVNRLRPVLDRASSTAIFADS
jgi:hypothetical protein